jgi:hypothetical protein
MRNITVVFMICLALISSSFNSLPFISNTSKKTYCFDDSFGSGNKFELSLIDGGKASIIVRRQTNVDFWL